MNGHASPIIIILLLLLLDIGTIYVSFTFFNSLDPPPPPQSVMNIVGDMSPIVNVTRDTNNHIIIKHQEIIATKLV